MVNLSPDAQFRPISTVVWINIVNELAPARARVCHPPTHLRAGALIMTLVPFAEQYCIVEGSIPGLLKPAVV